LLRRQQRGQLTSWICREETIDASQANVTLAAVRWRWPAWHDFSHKNRTQRFCSFAKPLLSDA
jgi:hypothetical protein